LIKHLLYFIHIIPLETQLLDKFSIGGKSRAGQLLIPPPGARKLGVNQKHITPLDGHEQRELQASGFLKGYGCDSNDNDNNGSVDECEEDQVPVSLRLQDGGVCHEKYFATEESLRDCIERYLFADDDCYTPTTPHFRTLGQGTCADTTATYDVTTTACAAQNQASATFGPFKLDTERPVVTILNCPATPLPQSLEMVDIGPLGITASDNCDIEKVGRTVLCL